MTKKIKTHMGTISKERHKAILKHLSKPNPSELKGIPKGFRKSPKKSASMPKDLSGEKTRLWKEKKTYDKTRIVEPERYERGAVERWDKKRKKILQKKRAMPGIKKKNQLIINSIRDKEAKQLIRKEMMKKGLGKAMRKVGPQAVKIGLGTMFAPAAALIGGLTTMFSMEGLSPHDDEAKIKEHYKELENIKEIRKNLQHKQMAKDMVRE